MPPEQLDAQAIQNLKRRVDLRVIAAQFTQLHGGREQVGPCPRCGGVDRFHCQADQYFCRQCQPPEAGKGRHDVFSFAEFVGLAHGFREAYTVVCDWANAVPVVSQPTRMQPDQPQPAPAHWQTRLDQEVQRCQQRLSGSQGHPGRTYLAGRQIAPETIRAAHLGMALRMDAEGQKVGPLPYLGSMLASRRRFNIAFFSHVPSVTPGSVMPNTAGRLSCIRCLKKQRRQR